MVIFIHEATEHSQHVLWFSSSWRPNSVIGRHLIVAINAWILQAFLCTISSWQWSRYGVIDVVSVCLPTWSLLHMCIGTLWNYIYTTTSKICTNVIVNLKSYRQYCLMLFVHTANEYRNQWCEDADVWMQGNCSTGHCPVGLSFLWRLLFGILQIQHACSHGYSVAMANV